jgi:hypothetical protein
MIFKCIATGNTVEFTAAHDIEAMLKHHQYVVVSEEKPVVEKVADKEAPKATVKE